MKTHPSIRPGDIYFTDNGRTLHGRCLGNSARLTLRDISGQPIERATQGDLDEWATSMGEPMRCECCGGLDDRGAGVDFVAATDPRYRNRQA